MKKYFIFVAILNFDALCDKCAGKISSFYFSFLITLTSTSVSHSFPTHKIFCLSFNRTDKSDAPCYTLCKNRVVSCFSGQ